MNKKDMGAQAQPLLKQAFCETEAYVNIKKLLLEQDFAVLCTRGDLAPYGSLLAFHASDDLRHILFATLTDTKKFQHLEQCDQVAMVIDSRDQSHGNKSDISAVTINGTAKKIESIVKIEDAKQKLLEKHQYLHELVSSDSCVFFNVEIMRCLYVTHVQEVVEWIPS